MTTNNTKNGYVKWQVFWGIIIVLISVIGYTTATAQDNRVDIRGLQSDTQSILNSVNRIERLLEK